MTDDQASVAVFETQDIFRAGLKNLIAASGRFRVVAAAADHFGALKLAAAEKPDIIFADLGLASDSIQMIRSFTAACRESKVIVMAPCNADVDMAAAFGAGARGFANKAISERALFEMVDCVRRGQTYADPTLAGAMLTTQRDRSPEEVESIRKLSPREQVVLSFLAKGLTNKEIARRGAVSEKTIKHHVSQILQKLDVRNRVEAALLARGAASQLARARAEAVALTGKSAPRRRRTVSTRPLYAAE